MQAFESVEMRSVLTVISTPGDVILAAAPANALAYYVVVGWDLFAENNDAVHFLQDAGGTPGIISTDVQQAVAQLNTDQCGVGEDYLYKCAPGKNLGVRIAGGPTEVLVRFKLIDAQ